MCFYYAGAERPSFVTDRTVTARKPRPCCECDRTIRPGEEYRVTAGVWDGTFSSFAQCLRCVRLIEAVVAAELAAACERAEAAPAYGQLFQDVEDWDRYADDFRRLGMHDAAALIPAELLHAEAVARPAGEVAG